MPIYEYRFPTHVVFGHEAISRLPELLVEAGLRRPLVVTDRTLIKLAPVRDTLAVLTAEGLVPGLFANVWGHPVESQVTAGLVAYRSHDADAVVAVGGGAALDVGKAVALMVGHRGRLFDFQVGAAAARPPARLARPPLFAVPTTNGSGSEVSGAAFIAEEETGVKRALVAPELLPDHAILDAALILELPARATAETGLVALAHLVEAYLARGFHPLCDGIALEGLRLLARHLPLSVDFAAQIEDGAANLREDSEHLQARGMLLNASVMGGVAVQKAAGLSRSMAHALAAVCGLGHGLGVGVSLPYAVAFTAEAVPERLAELAQAVGAHPWTSAGFIAWLRRLNESLGLPATLGDAGVRVEHVPQLARLAHGDGGHRGKAGQVLSVRPLDEADFQALFMDALTGPLPPEARAPARTPGPTTPEAEEPGGPSPVAVSGTLETRPA